MQKNIFFRSHFLKDGFYQLQCCGSFRMLTLATQEQAERRKTPSTAIGGPVSGLVDQTPSTLILTMGVKKMIEVNLSFS